MFFKNKKLLCVICAALAALAVSAGIFAASETSSVTVVSLDYIANVLKPWVNQKVAAADGQYVIVYLTKGQKLLPTASAELVLRSGSATALAPDTTQGLSDLTSGSEIYKGSSVTKNHQLLVPRADGRGIVITSNEAYVMVRGDYEIK